MNKQRDKRAKEASSPLGASASFNSMTYGFVPVTFKQRITVAWTLLFTGLAVLFTGRGSLTVRVPSGHELN